MRTGAKGAYLVTTQASATSTGLTSTRCVYPEPCSYNHGAHAVVATGSDNKIKHLVAGNVEFEARLDDVLCPALALGRDDRLLLATTDLGAVRSYVWVSARRSLLPPSCRSVLSG